jgi:hypothetical protein
VSIRALRRLSMNCLAKAAWVRPRRLRKAVRAFWRKPRAVAHRTGVVHPERRGPPGRFRHRKSASADPSRSGFQVWDRPPACGVQAALSRIASRVADRLISALAMGPGIDYMSRSGSSKISATVTKSTACFRVSARFTGFHTAIFYGIAAGRHRRSPVLFASIDAARRNYRPAGRGLPAPSRRRPRSVR